MGGTRWRVRGSGPFTQSGGWPPAYAKALKQDDPLCVPTFESEASRVGPETFTASYVMLAPSKLAEKVRAA